MHLQFASDEMVSSTDSDISIYDYPGDMLVDTHYIVIMHDSVALNINPALLVNGSQVTLGAVGSNSQYIVSRVSSTQTVIKRSTNEAITIDVQGVTFYAYMNGYIAPIGMAVIGESFIIE